MYSVSYLWTLTAIKLAGSKLDLDRLHDGSAHKDLLSSVGGVHLESLYPYDDPSLWYPNISTVDADCMCHSPMMMFLWWLNQSI